MKRPMLVSGTAIGLCSFVLVLTEIKLLPFLLPGAVSVFILYLIKPLKLRDKIAIPTVCISVVLCCIFFGIFHFTKLLPETKLHNTVTYISGKIISTPAETQFGTKFVLETDKIGNNNKTTKIQVCISSDYDMDFKLYDYVSVPNAKLKVIKDEYNKPDSSYISDGVILEASGKSLNVLWESERTPFYYCLRLKEIITRQVNLYLTEYDAGLLLGMLFGDKTQIDGGIKKDFIETGISHLLAVSGLHTCTWCACIIAFLSLFKFKEKQRNLVCLIFLWALCVASAFTPSVMRASIMMGIILLAPFFNEEADSLNSLGFAVTILILNNPYIVISPSFLLSVFATLGVLCAISIFGKIRPRLTKIKNIFLFKGAEYFLISIISTVFAGLFTLPVCAYFFGAVSLMGPLTNILCVKPAFWSLLAGAVATAITFLPQSIPQSLAIFIFKISRLFSDFVTKTAHTLAKFPFSALPIHREYFLLGLIGVVIIALTGLFLFKRTKNHRLRKISLISCTVVLCISLIRPCTTLLPPSLTVINVGNGVNISLRQGLKYAYINCGADTDIEFNNCLPTANCEKLNFLYIGKADDTANGITDALTSYHPENSVVTEYVKDCLNGGDLELPENTLISNSHTHRFNDEITVQTVDTYPVGYVIIKGCKKTVAICYGENTDMDLLFSTYGTPHVLVLSGNIPERLPQKVDALIISSDSSVILNENAEKLKGQCQKYYTTAENGNIKITL